MTFRLGEYQGAEVAPFKFTRKCCRIYKLRITDSGLAVATRVDRHQCRQASDIESTWLLSLLCQYEDQIKMRTVNAEWGGRGGGCWHTNLRHGAFHIAEESNRVQLNLYKTILSSVSVFWFPLSSPPPPAHRPRPAQYPHRSCPPRALRACWLPPAY